MYRKQIAERREAKVIVSIGVSTDTRLLQAMLVIAGVILASSDGNGFWLRLGDGTTAWLGDRVKV